MTDRSLVRDLMTVGVATCSLDTPVVEVARLLLDKQLEAVVVLDPEGHAPGIVSRDDLVRCYTRHDGRDLTAADVMTEDVPQLPSDIPLTAAAHPMKMLSDIVSYVQKRTQDDALDRHAAHALVRRLRRVRADLRRLLRNCPR